MIRIAACAVVALFFGPCQPSTSAPAGGGAIMGTSCGACPAGQACVAGTCAPCAAPAMACGDACIDTSEDPDHCGGCDRACPPSAECHAGACVTVDRNVSQWPAPPDAPPDSEYTVSADGLTVTDSVTGLVWQRQPATVSPGSRSSAAKDPAAACRYLAYAGFSSGWRVPTMIELYSILDLGIQSEDSSPYFVTPLVDRNAFPNVLPDTYWSASSRDENGTTIGWFVDFGGGVVRANPTPVYFDLANANLRCVRGGKMGAAAARYTAGNGTVHDAVTGLTWQQPMSTSTYTWGQAQSYCASLTLGSSPAPWRMPTAKELVALIDPAAPWQNPAVVDAAVFPQTADGETWTATALYNTMAKWWVEFGNGEVSADIATNLYVDPNALAHVRCVQ